LALVLAGVGAAAALAVAPSAIAKENVKATLITHIPLGAPAGTKLRVTWRLFTVDENGEHQPFGAGGLFVRLLSASGAASEESVASSSSYRTGEYQATVVVPKGGIRDVQLGLEGWVSDASGTHRSDLTFPITNDPVPNPRPVAGAAGSGSRAWLVLVSLVSVLGLAVAAFAVWRQRSRSKAVLQSLTESRDRQGVSSGDLRSG
jgi:hypothetical protein